MQISSALTLIGLLVGQTVAHGLPTLICDGNGTCMPGLTVMDGVPRDCPSAACGAQKDTSIMRDDEMDGSKASALGRTNGGGPVDPATVISAYMGLDNSNSKRGLLARGLLAMARLRRDITNDIASAFTNAGGTILNGLQDFASGGNIGIVKESGNQKYAGQGASKGLPIPNENGIITVNQDGAGPLVADVDFTSGGNDPGAFEPATVVKNIQGVAGFSTSSAKDYEIQIQVPNKKCHGTVRSVPNVCVCRIRNQAISGPFGGAVAFTN
ncbi:hypothetical protein EYZ11_013023 [Aspergillus tanneri]|uniref:Cell surface protein n=1 Tax=Aspergillus tanneri TaxID=1220188 RepID=A0A4S3IZ83_9EURO|nr:uncharacterized protein ATNIH1004_005752 [Aspergillus tanneri]KAA8647069.1 hypothetical protein ATNIH1004_005752 [Aspergillus tanneri]THC87532.1 hypothetical protein EYZ11_013023 [Aspergillus tanneri]